MTKYHGFKDQFGWGMGQAPGIPEERDNDAGLCEPALDLVA